MDQIDLFLTLEFFRYIRCIHVPNQKMGKLDESTKYALLGVSGKSKAYKLYDLINKTIHVSRDVKLRGYCLELG